MSLRAKYFIKVQKILIDYLNLFTPVKFRLVFALLFFQLL